MTTPFLPGRMEIGRPIQILRVSFGVPMLPVAPKFRRAKLRFRTVRFAEMSVSTLEGEVTARCIKTPEIRRPKTALGPHERTWSDTRTHGSRAELRASVSNPFKLLATQGGTQFAKGLRTHDHSFGLQTGDGLRFFLNRLLTELLAEDGVIQFTASFA